MIANFVEVVPLSHRQGNFPPLAAIRWHYFGNRPAIRRPFGYFSWPSDTPLPSFSPDGRFSRHTPERILVATHLSGSGLPGTDPSARPPRPPCGGPCPSSCLVAEASVVAAHTARRTAYGSRGHMADAFHLSRPTTQTLHKGADFCSWRSQHNATPKLREKISPNCTAVLLFDGANAVIGRVAGTTTTEVVERRGDAVEQGD